MADHGRQEMIHAAAAPAPAAMYGGVAASSATTTAQGSNGGGDWWSAAVAAAASCSAPDEMPGFGGGWPAAVAASHADASRSSTAGNAAASFLGVAWIELARHRQLHNFPRTCRASPPTLPPSPCHRRWPPAGIISSLS
ncbi:hypothetical protein GUJ93_ZPchr0010g7766, partial [Zizania palustris]